MKIYISRDYRKVLCAFILYFTIFIGFLTYNFSVSTSVLYLCDVVVVILLVALSKRMHKLVKQRDIVRVLTPIFILLVFGSIVAILNGGSIVRWLWSIRNWGRLFAFFLIVLSIFEKKDCDRFCDFACKLYHVNFIVVLFQALFLRGRYTQDSLNGLYGRDVSSVHITMTLVVVSIVTARYVTKKITYKKFLLIMAEVFIVAIIAELRVIPVIVIILVVLAYIMSFKLTVRKVFKAIGGIGIGVVGVLLVSYFLKIFYPETALNYSVRSIIDAASTTGGYGHSGGIDRLTFITVINERIFNLKKEWIYGIGIGNAEYSAFTSLCSPFYQIYGNTLGYLRFSSAMLYIETGIIGIALYFLSFFNVFIHFFNMVKTRVKAHSFVEDSFYEILGGEIALINIFYIIYNNLQRTDVAYILAFYLAISFVGIQKGYVDGKG